MKLAIMQPYFLPYIGYFQLIAAADVFIVYDNIKYTKKGWINRNRLLSNGTDAWFTLPLKQAPDVCLIDQRELSASFDPAKLLRQFKGAYAHAPYFTPTHTLLEGIVGHLDKQLFGYLHHSIVALCDYLGIRTAIRVSSAIDIDHSLKGQDKVLALCRALGASTYINLIGGTALYDHPSFREQGIELRFIRALPCEYAQFAAPFVPWLSLIDMLMFNGREVVRDVFLKRFEWA
jgi:hypothetical protein